MFLCYLHDSWQGCILVDPSQIGIGVLPLLDIKWRCQSNLGEKCRGYKSAEHDEGSSDVLSRQSDTAMIKPQWLVLTAILYVFGYQCLLGNSINYVKRSIPIAIYLSHLPLNIGSQWKIRSTLSRTRIEARGLLSEADVVCSRATLNCMDGIEPCLSFTIFGVIQKAIHYVLWSRWNGNGSLYHKEQPKGQTKPRDKHISTGGTNSLMEYDTPTQQCEMKSILN